MPETVVHFQIRMPPTLHERLASWAKDEKASLNALIVGILEKASAQNADPDVTVNIGAGAKEKSQSHA